MNRTLTLLAIILVASLPVAPAVAQESPWRLGIALGYGEKSNPLILSEDIPIVVDLARSPSSPSRRISPRKVSGMDGVSSSTQPPPDSPHTAVLEANTMRRGAALDPSSDFMRFRGPSR
jgi:hypothetical protein